MTTFTPARSPDPPPPAGGNVVARTVERLRAASGSTPGRYRLWSLAAVVVLVLAAVAATASAARMRGATNRVRTNSGPVLVATQQLVSSLAEADAAQTAAFLSGRDEDPEQRRLYEQALARAEQQMEQIAARVGDDAGVHDLLQRVSVRVSTYAGLVEAARASNRAGVAEAGDYLVQSVSLGNAIVQDDLTALTAATQERLRQDEGRRTQGWIVALVVVALGLAVLGFGQAQVAKTSRRLVNLPLAVGTLALAAALVWLVLAERGSGSAIRDARRQGYDSIALTAQLQTAGFGAKANETLALVTGNSNQRAALTPRCRTVAVPAGSRPGSPAAIRAGTAEGAPGGLLGPGRDHVGHAPVPGGRGRGRRALAALPRHGGRPAVRLVPGRCPGHRRGPLQRRVQRVQLLGRGRPGPEPGPVPGRAGDGRRSHVPRPHRRPAPRPRSPGGRPVGLPAAHQRLPVRTAP